MEGVLRDQNISEMIPCEAEGPVLFFPIRHHSPVCSWHLVQVMQQYRPEIVLIEGPVNANALIPVLTDEGTQLPAAFYCFYKDTAKLLSKEAEDFSCYYPFLYASPEYNALKEAKAMGIPAQFIDLPYGEILYHTAAAQGLRSQQPQSYAHDHYLSRSRFYKALCEKTQLRSFEEFWEKYFEIEGLHQTTAVFLQTMHTYCAITRMDTPTAQLEADGTLAREAHMAACIAQAMQTHRRVLVVTGDFHSLGLAERLRKGETAAPALHDFSTEVQDIFPMAYSYEAADALHGYASGMPYPMFYDTIFRTLRKGNQPVGIYRQCTLDLLVQTAKEASKRDVPLSIADITAAHSLMEGLAALRDTKEPGMAEVTDGVTAAFIKGEKTLATSLPLELLQKLATGSGIGKLGINTHVPPLIRDFELQCHAHRLNIRRAVPQQTELSLFAKGKGMETSRFLHRMEFLGTEFAERLKGPDLHSGTDRSRVREVWKYTRTPHVDATLIEHTTDGANIEAACRRLAEKKLQQTHRCEEAARLSVDCFLMGIPLERADVSAMESVLLQDGDFFSLGKGLQHFDMLHELQGLYRMEDPTLLQRIIQCFNKLLALVPSMAAVQPEQADACIGILRTLYGIVCRVLPERREDFQQALVTLTSCTTKEPTIYGGTMGLLYAMDADFRTQAETVMRGYLQGSAAIKKQGAFYLKGLFSTARDIALTDESFLKMTDALISEMDLADFQEVLPALRLAFSYFTPAEIQDTAAAAAALHAADASELLQAKALDEGLHRFGMQLDAEICAELEGGIQHGSAADSEPLAADTRQHVRT